MRRALAALAAAVAIAGCGSSEGTAGGGRIVGETLTVYTLLPNTPVAREIIDGQKLALAEAGGRAGAFKVNFAADFLDRDEPEKNADTVREAIRDLQIVAAVTDLDSVTARTTIPLFNAAGILQLSPGATHPGFVAAGFGEHEPGRWQPSQQRTFAPLAPHDAAQASALAARARPPVLVEAEPDSVLAAELRRRLRGRLTTDPAEARTVIYAGSDPENARVALGSIVRELPGADVLVPESLLRAGLELPAGVRALTSAPAPTVRPANGRCATRFTQLGHEAMRSLLAAIERAGARASDRRALAGAYFADYEAPAAFEVVTETSCV